MGEKSDIPQAVKAALLDLYGDRLAKVILYGSRARGDFHGESDWDFLVVLRDDEVLPGREVRFAGDTIARLNLLFRTWISHHPTTLRRLEESNSLFYQNIRREGIEV
jgi:predicted nucleotidyltransferase